MKTKGFSYSAIVVMIALAAVSLAYLVIKQKNTQPGTVILLLGTSSAGKSSIINELKKSDSKTLTFLDIDTFEVGYMAKHPGEIQPRHYFDAFYSSIKDEALKGHTVVVDTVPEDPDTVGHMRSIVGNIKLVTVLLYCPLATTMKRVEQRNALGKPEEKRELLLPVGQYQLLFKRQELPDERVLEKLPAKDLKQVVRGAIDSYLKTLPAELKDKVAQVTVDLEESYKKFVADFKLDERAEVIIVPRMKYDLVLDCTHAPAALAKEIKEILHVE